MPTFLKISRFETFRVAQQLKRSFPQLKHADVEGILDDLDFVFYREEEVKAPMLIRLTLPFAFLTMVLLIAVSPLKYIVTGKWRYKSTWLTNWFRSLGLG